MEEGSTKKKTAYINEANESTSYVTDCQTTSNEEAQDENNPKEENPIEEDSQQQSEGGYSNRNDMNNLPEEPQKQQLLEENREKLKKDFGFELLKRLGAG